MLNNSNLNTMSRNSMTSENAAFVGGYIFFYVVTCKILFGKALCPFLFAVWLVTGWKISRAIVDYFIVGQEEVKFFSAAAMFLGGLGILSLAWNIK